MTREQIERIRTRQPSVPPIWGTAVVTLEVPERDELCELALRALERESAAARLTAQGASR